MNKLLLLIAFIFICFVSCDGRDRGNKTNAEILKESKLLDSFSEKIEYIPDSFTEINTDTILSNGFRIKIRYHTHMKEYVSKNYKIDSINHKKHFYDFVSKITVYKGSKEIYKKDIYKRSLDEHSKYFATEVANLIMNPSYIDYERSLEKGKAVIVFPLCTTDTVNCLFYELVVDKNGAFEYKPMKNNNNFYH